MGEVSLVFPVYNERSQLPLLFQKLCEEPFRSYQIIFVDDGSQDESAELIESFKEKRHGVFLLRHKTRRGQHTALLTGMAWTSSSVVALADVDIVASLDLLPKMVKKSFSYDMVLTFRRYRENWQRQLLSSLFNRLVVQTYLKVPVRDIGCPLKTFSKEIAWQIIEEGGFFRYLRKMRHLNFLELELPGPLPEKRKSHYTFLRLLWLFWQTLNPPFLLPDQKALEAAKAVSEAKKLMSSSFFP